MSSYLKCWLYLLVIGNVSSIEVSPAPVHLKDVKQHNKNQTVRSEKVDLKVYYCSHCPGCKLLHTRHIAPAIEKIGSYIDFTPNPYGIAIRWKKDGKMVFDCIHGPEECYGNKLHACAIDILKNITKAELYNTCMMNMTWGGDGSTEMDATKCGESMKIDSKPIIECAEGPRGDDLLEYHGRETDRLHLDGVPYIVLNGKVTNGDIVDLKVYYECRCAPCVRFHLNKLHDALMKLRFYVDLKTYPYGNTRRTVMKGKVVYTCLHGQDECHGNKLHACAIDILKNTTDADFTFNTCLMRRSWGGNGSTDMDATNCAAQLGIDPVPIIECAHGQKGEELQEYYGKETNKANITQTPWVLLNGVYFHTTHGDLVKEICKFLSDPPSPCTE